MKYLIYLLIFVGACAIFTPALVYPDLTPMRLLIKCWGYYGTGLACEIVAVLLMRMERDFS